MTHRGTSAQILMKIPNYITEQYLVWVTLTIVTIKRLIMPAQQIPIFSKPAGTEDVQDIATTGTRTYSFVLLMFVTIMCIRVFTVEAS